MKLAFSIVALTALLVALGQGPALGKTGTRLVVDDDKVQCPSAGYSTLATAIAAAQPGDTILVCPGRYAGVNVSKAVQLRARAGETPDDRDSEAREADDCFNATPDPSHHAVIAGVVTLSATGGALRGFTLSGAATSVLLQATATVTENCFLANTTAIAGSSGGHGLISRNQFIGQTKNAISLVGASRVTIDGNIFERSATIRLTNASDNVIGHNQISASASTSSSPSAIRLETGSQRNTISHNTLTGGAAALALHTNGIRFDGDRITGNLVEHNAVMDFGKSGIRVKAGSGNTFRDNRVDHNGLLEVENGFELSAAATGNLFIGNHMHDNQNLDVLDKSVTGNTWIHSHCATSDPATICATVVHDSDD